ncbi:MAG TPA: phage holin family protein, partial [Phaeodactylibacter sp.]|nr:phage holin family protein [Phaeodactylibacter sp.]
YARVYLKQHLEYYKLDIAERVSKVISSAITMIVLLLLFLMMLGFLSVAAGFYLAELRGSYAEAFLIVAGGYLVLTLFVALFRRFLITNPVLSRVINVFFSE